MEEKESTTGPQNRIRQNMEPCKRTQTDRRQDDCEGFTYVSTVGWICRRERCRRKDGDGAS
jgi:hypothetical protein